MPRWGVAKQVRQRFLVPCTVGSSPTTPAIFSRLNALPPLPALRQLSWPIGSAVEPVLRLRLKQRCGGYVLWASPRCAVLPHIDDADFVVQAFDKPVGQSASWVNRACIELKKPFASIGQTDKNGRVGNIVVPGKTACSECVGLPEIIIHREHAAAPLTGPCVAILAGILTQEIVKFISGYTESRLLDRSLLIDVDTWEIKAINHAKQDNCPACF